MSWFAYVLVSKRHRTYVGITTDVERRLKQHNGELPGGARYTRANRPWSLGRTYGPYADRSSATQAEQQIKKLRGAQRLDWIS